MPGVISRAIGLLVDKTKENGMIFEKLTVIITCLISNTSSKAVKCEYSVIKTFGIEYTIQTNTLEGNTMAKKKYKQNNSTQKHLRFLEFSPRLCLEMTASGAREKISIEVNNTNRMENLHRRTF